MFSIRMKALVPEAPSGVARLLGEAQSGTGAAVKRLLGNWGSLKAGHRGLGCFWVDMRQV